MEAYVSTFDLESHAMDWWSRWACGVIPEEQEELCDLAGVYFKSYEQESGVESTTSSISATETKPIKPFNLHEISCIIFGNAKIRFDMDHRRLWKLSSEEMRVFNKIIKEEYHWEKGWVLMNLSRRSMSSRRPPLVSSL
jgi:hypothetical protein